MTSCAAIQTYVRAAQRAGCFVFLFKWIGPKTRPKKNCNAEFEQQLFYISKADLYSAYVLLSHSRNLNFLITYVQI